MTIHYALELVGLQARYKKAPAGITVSNLALPQGVYALIGDNGSGKSTFLSCLAGLIGSRGKSKVLGHDLDSADGRKQLVYLPHSPSGLDHLTVGQLIAYVQTLYSFQDAPMVTNLIAMSDLTALQDIPIKRLSQGQKQLAYLAATLASGAPIVLLDEPTVGLDFSRQQVFRNMINFLGGARTIIFSTHLQEDLNGIDVKVLEVADGSIHLNQKNSSINP